MRKIATIAAAVIGLALAGSALAWNDELSSSAVAKTDAYATSNGNGGSYMESGASASNTTGQYSYDFGSFSANTRAGAHSAGATSAYSFGHTYGNAFGLTGADARQSGYAEGGEWDSNQDGYTHAGSRAEVDSYSRTGVIYWGGAGASTWVAAGNDSEGGIYRNWQGRVVTYGDTDGYARSNSSKYRYGFASAHTHGDASSSGVGFGRTWRGGYRD